MRRDALAIAALAALLLAAWSPVLSNGFVYDDHKYILENPWIKDASFTPDIFSSSTSGFSPLAEPANTYRPMLYMLYMAEYLSFGLRPFYFHLVSLAAHIINAALVFLAALFLLERRGRAALVPALLAALVFGLHTINSEAVSWVSGSTELFFTLFVLAGMNLYMRSRSGLPVAPFFLAALLFKETAAALPVIMVLYDLSSAKTVRERWRGWAALAAVAVVYWLMRHNAVGGLMHHRQIELTFFETVINIFPLVAAYAGKIVYPVNLSAIYEFHPARSMLDWRVAAGALVVGAFFAAMFFARRRPAVMTGLAMMALPVLPVLYVPALSSSAMADRYLYLPTAGLAIIIAALVSGLDGRAKKGAIAAVSALLVAWTAGSVARAQVWKSDYALWADAVVKAPNAPNAHYNFAWASHAAGRVNDAVEHYRIAARLSPSADAHFNMGLIFMGQSMLAEAEAEFVAALAVDPGFDSARARLMEIRRLREAGA